MKNQILKTHVKLANIRFRFINHCTNMVNNQRGTFGLDSVLAIVTGLVIAAFIFIPGLRDFADDILTSMGTWWTAISASVFPTS